ncbi:MAG: M13 family metallopeptidase [Acidobacteriota bacterium]|nr:M13 family metallopeptidase [Acidobacteriota bacterium]
MLKFREFRFAAALLAAAAFLVGSNGAVILGQAAAENATAQSSPRGYDPANLDRSVKPCTDFYQFAVGGWRAKHPIPADYPAWGIIRVVTQRNQKILRRLLEQDAASHAPAGSNQRKLGDFYSSCMNEKEIESEGLKPLEPELRRISQIHNRQSLETEIARLQILGLDAPFGFTSQQDFKNSSEEIGVAWQGGLGLPNCTYYTKMDPKSKQIRAQYLAHAERIFKLMGDAPSTASAEAANIMKTETLLARSSMTPVELRNPKAVYHVMRLAELKTLMPYFSWPAFFREVGQPGLGSINAAQPEFLKTVNQAIVTLPLKDWRTYLRWQLIDQSAPYLSKPFVDEDFSFTRVLTGAEKLQPRWQRCVNEVDSGIGMALGKQYVDAEFPPAAKADALRLVNNLIAQLGNDISTISWMGPSTRQFALRKLSAMTKKIGYPEKWRDYSALAIAPGPYIANVLNADQFEFRRELNKIGKPVDRTEWIMTPPTVNAYYDPSMNEIVFPAGILQPPFFNSAASEAINYGDTGATIGHEMTHGFDDEGRQFDAQGNLKDWWTPSDLAQFNQRAACIVNQFDGYVVEGHLHENGKLVEGESIADLGGLVIAYKAFEKYMQGKPRVNIGGFTPEQLFFLGYAESWEQNIRPELERLRVSTDPHPLARFRVNGPLSNMPAFAAAWHCKPGDPMVRPPKEQCKIW